MNNQAADEGRSVALYWDFENLHASLCDEKEAGSYGRENRFKLQEPLVDVQAVVELAASFGPVAINRAYCNWQFFGRYREALLQNAVELVQLFPPGGAAKNGADIRLCLDAMEDAGRFPHIGTVVIVGGDSDFMPVSHKIKAAGRTLIGVGTRKSTNKHWAKSCDEFRYYESLVEPAPVEVVAPTPSTGEGASPLQAAEPVSAPHLPSDLLRRAIRLLAEKRGDAWVNKGEIWPMIKRLDATFSLADHNYTSFSAMVKSLDKLVEARPGPNDQQIRLR
ncbi:MAG TPA: NYN domain-containing protein [Ramlibacter sp.]|uniref:NYN domain-containing protein n=1 Tax=Ramlibacter sp. TaxID=1917967 RepID=UPI002ED1B989